MPVAESIGAPTELKSEGKIRHIGISNVSETQLREAQKVEPIVSVQNRYNAGDRLSEPIVDLCEQEQLAFLPWAPIREADRLSVVGEVARLAGPAPAGTGGRRSPAGTPSGRACPDSRGEKSAGQSTDAHVRSGAG